MKKRMSIHLVVALLVAVIGTGAYGAFTVLKKIEEATGVAVYTALGAHSRILEYAKTTGNFEYMLEAQDAVTRLEREVAIWHDAASIYSFDMKLFERHRQAGYETTDRNIAEGMEPFAHLKKVP